MFASLRFWCALVAAIFIAIGSMTHNASAVTVDVAKKCNALVAKAYPPRVIGNPAAGSEGTAQSRRDYFNKCVANDGNAEDRTDQGAK